MKKLLTILLTLVTAITCLGAFACSGGKKENTVKFTYVALKNNTTGFTTLEDDSAIAIGLKKGSALKAKMDEYFATFTLEKKTAIMEAMFNLVKDKNATYTPEVINSNESNGTLKVGMECAYEPFNWTQNDNKNGAVPIANLSGKYANGFDVQVARLVAGYLNMKLEIYQTEWDALIPGVQTGTLHAIVAGMSPTEERKAEIDFTLNYYSSNLVIITKEGSKIANCKNLAEIDVKGVKIAAQPGTFHLQALKGQTKNLTAVETLEDFVAMRVALEAGTIDGYVAEEPTAVTFCIE